MLISRACLFVLTDSFYIKPSKRLLTTSHPFNYTRLVKMSQVDESDLRSEKLVE